MFYRKQPDIEKENYKKMLSIMGSLTRLFSENDSPYLPYRIHENVFCKYFEAQNLSRIDCSADAKKDGIGIGLKTWVGSNDQKIAEFGKLRPNYKDLSGLNLIKEIAFYRNERIRITKKIHGIQTLIYHIIRRKPYVMEIIEHSFDYIDIKNITLLDGGNDNNTYFTDGKHKYHFNMSKSTLYLIFENLDILDTLEIDIMDDPYEFLMNLNLSESIELTQQNSFNSKRQILFNNQICLRLYSTSKNEKFVPLKSGLNQWNARGRKRNPNELYIAYPAEDKRLNPDFFPADSNFSILMPDGTELSAKLCQQGKKAIMSNPNKALGEWLLRKVFELKEGTIVTYDMLATFGIDAVIFTKIDNFTFAIDFAELGTYEDYLNTINSKKSN